VIFFIYLKGKTTDLINYFAKNFTLQQLECQTPLYLPVRNKNKDKTLFTLCPISPNQTFHYIGCDMLNVYNEITILHDIVPRQHSYLHRC